ncbi:MAG: hypothetical protein ABIJ04_12610 [Bacteroidota bacterium]
MEAIIESGQLFSCLLLHRLKLPKEKPYRFPFKHLAIGILAFQNPFRTSTKGAMVEVHYNGIQRPQASKVTVAGFPFFSQILLH